MIRYEKLLQEISLRKPKTILEIGTHMGRSAVNMIEEAQKFIKNIKSHLLHIESGLKTEPVKGQIEERFQGIKIMEPYEELKHWWKKATQKEKDNFLKWTKDQ